MDILSNLKKSALRWYHKREIESLVSHYRETTGLHADKKQVYSESGSYRAQLERLFSVGDATETGLLRDIGSQVVTICLSNKY